MKKVRNGLARGARVQSDRVGTELVHDWNGLDAVGPFSSRPFEVLDETLRDGIQSPSVVDPPLADKLELIELTASLGVAAANIGLPGAGPRALNDVTALARHIQKRKLKLQPTCAARTVPADIAPIAEVQQRAGIKIQAYTFIGSSPIRQYVEGWDIDHLLKVSATAIDFAVEQGLEVCYVTEDTTRSDPATLDRLFRNAIDHGATALCLCDTVGWATPEGVRKLIQWTRALIRGTGAEIRIDWHGHNDRGLAVTNALYAIEYGADRVHGCALGMGERVGNAALDQILLNLKLLGAVDWNLTNLVRYVQKASAACQFPIPRNYPLCGEDAFRTATGVHAAAIIKAEQRGDRLLADRIYSGVPASWFGRHQTIEVGPMSGMSNVNYWLKSRGLETSEETVRAVLLRAKSSDRTLTDAEILAVVKGPGKLPGKRRAAGQVRS
jgi:2-isopropylmalate synthase